MIPLSHLIPLHAGPTSIFALRGPSMAHPALVHGASRSKTEARRATSYIGGNSY